MLIIRGYLSSDRGSVRKIASDTAFLGGPSDIFFDDRELLADILTLYYTEYERESIFIAEVDGKVAGYLIGCIDIKRYKRIWITKILPLLIVKSIVKTPLIFTKKNMAFLYYCVMAFFKKELFIPDISDDYPAILHINIAKEYRDRGMGTKLIEEYTKYLKNKRVKGIHLTTISSDAVRFFEKNGFKVIHKKKLSCFAHTGHKNISKFLLVKDLFC